MICVRPDSSNSLLVARDTTWVTGSCEKWNGIIKFDERALEISKKVEALGFDNFVKYRHYVTAKLDYGLPFARHVGCF
jgi:hypothetical protein